jgi:hypothetical protein
MKLFTSLRRRALAGAVLLGSLTLVLTPWAARPVAAQSSATLHSDMRKLWEDHITWTRLFIISALDDLPDRDATTNRLLQNQTDIGNAIKPFYGDAAGDQLTALLRDHILIAADVVTAAKAGDSGRLQSRMADWQANADQIADFLAQANPDAWNQAEMRSMMRQHLDLTTAEVVARLNGDWGGDVAAYDRVHQHILMLADQLSDGLVAQFPSSFEG